LQTGDTRRPQRPSGHPRQSCHLLDRQHPRMQRLGNTAELGTVPCLRAHAPRTATVQCSSGLLQCMHSQSIDSGNAPPGIGGGTRGGGETKLQRSPNGVRTPAGSKGTNIVRELTVALAHSQAARSLHSDGRPEMHGTDSHGAAPGCDRMRSASIPQHALCVPSLRWLMVKHTKPAQHRC